MAASTDTSAKVREGSVPAPPKAVDGWDRDPLSPDAADDGIVVTTRRRLARLVVSAVDVGARFDRERAGCDAVAWMLAPHEMFDGRPAVEACQSLRGCLRTTVLHGLSIGFDAAPADLDGLLGEDGAEPDPETDPLRIPSGPAAGGRPRLLSAWIDATATTQPGVHFHAMVTADPAAFGRSLVQRFGPDAAGAAEVEVGFDPDAPRAVAFVSEAMRKALTLAAAAPESAYAAGLDVVVEQRFGS